MVIEHEVKERILEAIFKEYKEDNVLACCIYGSYAAGYARPDSDYDMMVVLCDYMAKIGYKYVKEPIMCSILTIEKKMLLDDAKKSGLGEFVSGRFLNIYEPLVGKEFLNMVEVEYKKRVILEILMEFNGKYHPILDTIKFPLEYFLFEKLRRRALFYPPALYSYTKTYSEPLRKQNLDFTLGGFRRAAEKLAMENNSISFHQDKIWVSDVKKFNKVGKLKAAVEETRRDLKSYATHIYSGRVGFNIILNELKSKIRRQSKLSPLEDLKSTSKYLEVPEGTLLVNEKSWVRRVAEALGITGEFAYRTQKIGGDGVDKIINVAQKYIFEENGKMYEVVVKKFKDPRNIKWAVLALATLTDKRFEFVPLKRLSNEYHMNLALKANGFNTPKVYALDLDRTQLVTDFVDGENLSNIINRRDYKVVEYIGLELGRLHSKEITLGDSKPDNMIFTKEGLFFTDLEQAKFGGDKTWDLAEFLNYSLAFTFDTEAAEKMVSAFSTGYLKYGVKEDLERIKQTKYSIIFKPIVTPKVSKTISSSLDKALR
ncbi:MAG: hypothetical protein QXJ17_05250 [Nitrososphaeria archaeon]